MFSFLKKLFSKKGLSDVELARIKGLIEKKLLEVKSNSKVIQLEIDLNKKVSQKVAEIAMEQLEKEYSEKLGKKVCLYPKNCF